MSASEESYGFGDNLWDSRAVVANDGLFAALDLDGSEFVEQLYLVVGDGVDDGFWDVVAVEGWVHFRLLVGRKHRDLESDPAFHVHETTVADSGSKGRFVKSVGSYLRRAREWNHLLHRPRCDDACLFVRRTFGGQIWSALIRWLRRGRVDVKPFLIAAQKPLDVRLHQKPFKVVRGSPSEELETSSATAASTISDNLGFTLQAGSKL